MAYIFTKKQFQALEKIIKRTENDLSRTLKDKTGTSTLGDSWHGTPFRVAYVEELQLRKRLADLKKRKNNAEIIEPKKQNKEVLIGNKAVIERENGKKEKLILDGYIIKPAPNLFSIYSPLGKKIKGAKKGQTKIVEIGGRKQKIKILEILNPPFPERKIYG